MAMRALGGQAALEGSRAQAEVRGRAVQRQRRLHMLLLQVVQTFEQAALRASHCVIDTRAAS
jgi:hypothetical protein